MKRMKTTNMKWALIAMTSGIMFFSCKKEKSNASQCSISMTGLAGSYKLTALQYTPEPGAAPLDYLAPMEDCAKDDSLILHNDGTYDYKNSYLFSPAGDMTSWCLPGAGMAFVTGFL